MVELNLGTNQLNSLPDDISKLQNLEVLILSNNLLRVIEFWGGGIKIRALIWEKNLNFKANSTVNRQFAQIAYSRSRREQTRVIAKWVGRVTRTHSARLGLQSAYATSAHDWLAHQFAVFERGREQSELDTGRDRPLGESRTPLLERQSQFGNVAARVGLVHKIADHVYWELSPTSVARGDRSRWTVTCHTSGWFFVLFCCFVVVMFLEN